MKWPPTFVRASNLLSSSPLEGCRSTWQDHWHFRHLSGNYMSQHIVQTTADEHRIQPLSQLMFRFQLHAVLV